MTDPATPTPESEPVPLTITAYLCGDKRGDTSSHEDAVAYSRAAKRLRAALASSSDTDTPTGDDRG